jgi:hypothetical protein
MHSGMGLADVGLLLAVDAQFFGLPAALASEARIGTACFRRRYRIKLLFNAHRNSDPYKYCKKATKMKAIAAALLFLYMGFPLPTVAAGSIEPDEGQLTSHSHYTNKSGRTVHSPSRSATGKTPAGATAKCRDGNYSFSKRHRGTCSGHGGVSEWLD